jgi:hypothetical protein
MMTNNTLTARQIGLAMLMAGMMFIAMLAGVATVADRREDPPGQNKITICHKPGTSAEQTKDVPPTALDGHLGHGDYRGPCAPRPEEPTPTKIIPPTPEQATPTNTPVPPTATNTPVPIPPTNTPVPVRPTEELVVEEPTPTPTATQEWVFDAPEPADTCDLCTAQESALLAEARWKHTLADTLEALMNGAIPEVVKFWRD